MALSWCGELPLAQISHSQFLQVKLIDAAKRGEEDSLEAFILDKENKVNINAKDSIGQTALHWACRNGHDGIVRILIKYRANLNILDPQNETPIHKAAWKNHVDTIRPLVETGKIDLTIKNKDGNTPLQMAKDENARRLLVPRPIIKMARRAQACGVAWIAVHGRTSSQRSSHPVDYDAIKLVKEHLDIPIFANGDIFTLTQANEIRQRTGVNGVMSARGILCNPALFSGYDVAPPEGTSLFTNTYDSAFNATVNLIIKANNLETFDAQAGYSD
eukprot:gene7876-9246_t